MKTTTARRTFLTTCALAGAAAARPLAVFGQAVDNATQASAPSALRITDVKCGYMRGSLFVKIHTNQGIWGCGEAVDAIQGTYQLVQSFGQRIRNQSPLNVHRLFEQIRKGGVFGGRAVRHVRGRADRRGNSAVGSRRQGAERAGLPAARREVPRPYPRLLRYGAVSGEAAHAGAFRPGGHEGREGRLHRHEVRPRSGQRPEQVRPVQLDGESRRKSSAWWTS